jgi:hypothetical protein
MNQFVSLENHYLEIAVVAAFEIGLDDAAGTRRARADRLGAAREVLHPNCRGNGELV